MRLSTILSACVCLLIPSTCFAVLTSTVGNKQLSAANYVDWPQLVDAINDPSRVFQVWCNGNEDFSYSGDTATLNRVLKKFARTEAQELTVVLRPGPGHSVTVDGEKKQIDWSIHMIGGIARAMIQHHKLTSVWDMHPTLTIYVTDRLELNANTKREGKAEKNSKNRLKKSRNTCDASEIHLCS